MNFKNIHIGSIIKSKVKESEVDIVRICNFFGQPESDIVTDYEQAEIATDRLLKWSKLLEYDFFRIYTQHLILYAPSKNSSTNTDNTNKSVPQFRKNIYSIEVIHYIVNKVISGEKTKKEIIEEYRIPKTTLYKWLYKYNSN